MATLLCPDTGATLPAWQCPETGKVFPTGATPTPRHQLLSAIPFMPLTSPPAQIAYVPKYRSNFGNDRYGDCVTAEEGFAKSCEIPGVQPSIEIPESTVIAYARGNGDLNGADLGDVCDKMARKGFMVSSQEYKDGGKQGVDFSNETILQAAIAQGPVKIAIAAGSLPGGAGSRDGWFSLSAGSRRTDHCTSLCGYGTADWLYQQLGVPLPSGLPGSTLGYLQYTWSTIGFVNHHWIMGTVDEAWLRTPTTIGVPPITPPTPPGPPIPPGPQPFPQTITLPAIAAGEYLLVPKVHV
jgi:hypothetical protein